jgi:cholinesterase
MSAGKFVVVDTEYGPVKGAKKDNALGMEYVNFQGIPYMKPPVGSLKFRVIKNSSQKVK